MLNTGLAAQVGLAEETTHGTPATVDRFQEFLNETLSMQQARIESKGLRTGRYTTTGFALGAKVVGGAINYEVADKGFGVWLKHALGAAATTQPDATNAPAVYKHTFTPGTLPAGLTVQVGRPDVNGTVLPFTYPGCMVNEWNLSATVGELVTAGFTVDGQDEKTDVALAAATFPASQNLLVFTGATLQVAGGEVPVNAASVQGNNGLGTDRVRLGRTTRKVPTQGRREWSGEFTAEFDGLSLYQRYVNGEQATLVLNCEGPVIGGTIKSGLKVTLNVRFDGNTPQVDGPDEVPLTMAYKVVDNGSPISVEYVTTDATP